MNKIITCGFGENVIQRLAGHIVDNFAADGRDLSRLAVVFGGRRPALFLRQELARITGKSYLSPRFFSAEEFIRWLLTEHEDFANISELEACYTIYNLIREHTPEILPENDSFADFLPWAREIASFIDELDLEDVPPDKLAEVQASAQIGFEAPEKINILLSGIIVLRRAYHRTLKERRLYSRGLMYLEAARQIKNILPQEFEQIIFGNLFYLHNTEKQIIKHLYTKNMAQLFFQRDGGSWPILDKLGAELNCRIMPEDKTKPAYKLNIYKGFDTHSQAGIVNSEILPKLNDCENTVIVLPQSGSLIPLLTEIAPRVKNFNVSMGFPLNRSPVYTLFQDIFRAQATSKEGAYYTRDYLKVMLNPLIKNLDLTGRPATTRILCHKLEEILLGREETSISGSLFLKLADTEGLRELYTLAAELIGQGTTKQELESLLRQIHDFAFRCWEKINNFSSLADLLTEFLDLLINKSFPGSYPLNLEIIERIYGLKDQLAGAKYRQETFQPQEIFKIFSQLLCREVISFSGSPLAGLQVLGLLETRTLSFRNVIVLDANEGTLPRLRTTEPLVPRQIMVNLGLNRYEQEEEIQRYHFLRLVSGAKNVHLIYNDSPEKEKSRFLEELIWSRQKRKKSLTVAPARQARFQIDALPPKGGMPKSPAAAALLADFEFSPSSIDTYLNCPLQFYYQYVLRLEEKGELLAEPESREIGNFIHNLLEDTFRPFLARKPLIDDTFRKKFQQEFSRQFEQKMKKRLGADAFMVKDIMRHRLQKFLAKESERDVKKILCLEDSSLGSPITLAGKKVCFKCRVDRIDLLSDDTVLVLDYKTGSGSQTPAALRTLEKMPLDRQAIKEKIHSFQLPVYYHFARRKFSRSALNAALYNLRTTELNYLINPKKLEELGQVMDICLKALEVIVEEIRNPGIDFTADETNPRLCEYCPFFYLCR